MLYLSLNCQTEEELHTCFKNLFPQETVTRPMRFLCREDRGADGQVRIRLDIPLLWEDGE